MAEIEMERRPRRSPWMWIVAAVLVLVLAVGAWLLFARGTTGYNVAPAANGPETTRPMVEQVPPEGEPGEPYGELLHPEPTDAPEVPEESPRR